ncbi:class I SAM-dependent methyltransferase [Yinghuangia seranimata]|uniref:class I SAM-dependent methyltransferase n=1 Tax=Yinghuangia seranimata TaxID=408067 RepID=UPI00248AED18|nr:class I SAM-dependent methyltransferase [Yinghuangia seranimata]MDI2127933.1 class I SAM-dependent methyltransferase [Yinghuangia seranimata]
MVSVTMHDSSQVARLRAALDDADYTVDGCLDALGPQAYGALSRSETVPALRALRGDGGPLATLIRLFLLQTRVPYAQALGALPFDEAVAGGLLERDGDEVRALVDIRPYGEADTDWWVVSDLGSGIGGVSGPLRPDHVLGIGGASTTLAGITVREPADRVLDLGTGCGVQALHASRHARSVTATDVNRRALDLTRLTMALSGVSNVGLAEGSLFEPVEGETYDLIVSNPPFVISPKGRFTYRDGGLPGDGICRRLVGQAPAYLADGGFCQLLANWQHVKGQDWHDRLRDWLAPTGCDAWVVQREVQDPAQYAELWLRDAGDHQSPEYAARYDAWLDAFEQDGVEGVGFGWITLRKSGSADPVVHVEDWPHPVEQPLGSEVAAWFARQDALRAHDDAALLDTAFTLAPAVLQEQTGQPGAEDPEYVVLRQQRGMCRADRVDTVGAALAGASDGRLTAGAIVDAIAELLGEDRLALREAVPGPLRSLVADGFLMFP